MNSLEWEEILNELQSAVAQPNHPYRFPVIATLGLEAVPRLRTVVLRHFTPNPLRLTFYTDARSKKVTHIKENQKVSALCYHPEHKVQIRLDGIAELEVHPENLEKYRRGIPEPTRIEYQSAQIPGTVIRNPSELEYLNEGDFFAAVHIYPFKIEYLKLERPRHTRMRFSKSGTSWEGEYLAP